MRNISCSAPIRRVSDWRAPPSSIVSRAWRSRSRRFMKRLWSSPPPFSWMSIFGTLRSFYVETALVSIGGREPGAGTDPPPHANLRGPRGNPVPEMTMPSSKSPAPPTVLLGPQRFAPTLAAVVRSLGIGGEIAAVTAGWQEREEEDAELRDHLQGHGCATVNLMLHARGEQAFGADPALRAAHGLRQ